MREREEVPTEARMSGSEAKLLLHLLRRNGVPGTNAELMRGSGVTDRRTFFRAKATLVEHGWFENPTTFIQPGWEMQPQKPYQLDIPTTKNLPVVGNANLSPLRALPLVAEVVPTVAATPTPTVIRSAERNWLAEAMQADIMPVADPNSHRSADFLARRECQISLLRDAFLAYFGKELTRESAKDMLQNADDAAEDVLDAFEATKAKGTAIERPRGYIMSILSKRRTEAAKRQATVRPANIGTLSRGGGDDAGEGGDFAYRPDPKAMAMEARMRALGLLNDDEDDDDDDE